MSWYIAETDDHGFPGALFFADDRGLTAQEELTAWLRDLIEMNYVTGAEPLIRDLWEFIPGGELRKLKLEYIEEKPEGDELQEMWQVTSSGKIITAFSVRLPS